MEQALIPSSSSPPSDHDHDNDLDLDHEPDFSPAGSPKLAEPHFSQPSDPPQAAMLSDDLRNKIIKQVEYYFSDENLLNDKFLMQYVTKNAEGFVPVGVIASFKKMKKLTKDILLIVAALRESEHLVVSSNGKMVKRLHSLPLAEVKDPMLCTVLVENLPEDHSVKDNLRRVFGEAGNIKHITIRDLHATNDPKKCTVAEKLLSGKLHALVEYETMEAAESAVVTLNNEQDWRFGLRVKLLKKTQTWTEEKNWRDSEPEKSGSTQVSDPVGNEENHYSNEHLDDSHDEEDRDHLSKGRNEAHLPTEKDGRKGRNQGHGRRQKHYGTNGHGHGTRASCHVIEPSKPPPGPKMPDGTRGFTLGRGRPLASN